MRKFLLTLVSVVGLAALVACGGGSSNNSTIVPGAPSGGNNVGFSNASLSGNYVFTANGYNAVNNYSYSVAGIFTADGSGHITSGTRDIVQDNGGQALNQAISGTYVVNQDGRGQILLTGGVIYRFVMESNSVAKLFEVSNSSDATGKIELQSNLTTTFAGPTEIITLNGEDSRGYPYGAIGGLVFASGGAITGNIDENDGGDVDNGTGSFLAATGSYTLAANGRGTATLTVPGALNQATHNFIVYEVSPNRLELISTDKNFYLYGYASPQTSVGASTGDQVFSIAGVDNNDNSVVEVGRLTLNGAAITGGVEDYNDGGTYNGNLAFTGSYSYANGRWTAPVSTISNGLIGWQVSPQLSVVLTNSSTPTVSSTMLETGVMRAQNTSATMSGNYAESLSGFNTGSGNVEILASSAASGGTLIGTFDSQTASGDYTDQSTSSVYSSTANGRASGSLFDIPVVMYTVDANTVYVISADATRIYQGKMVSQTAP